MTPSPRAIVRENQCRGCTGTADDLWPAPTGNLTQGPPAFHLGQRLGILVQGLKEELRQRSRRRAAFGRGTADPHPAGVGAGPHAPGPGAPEDGGDSSSDEDAALSRVLKCLGPVLRSHISR